jgi:rhodanese-related sulfurtransferase
MATTITREDIKALLDAASPVTLVEALPEKYWKHSHLPGAINIPHDRIRDLGPALLPDKDALIVVYCANEPCKNSTIASEELEALGYRKIREYVGGKQDWIDAGMPVEKGRDAA